MGTCVHFSHSLPSNSWWQTMVGWHVLSRPSAAEGGGRRPAFTGLATSHTRPPRSTAGNINSAGCLKTGPQYSLLLHYPYEVRGPEDYFRDIPKENIPKEMLDLAEHIIDSKVGHFQPKKFEDRYEDALRDLIKRKQAGKEITPAKVEKPEKKMNLMDALRASLQGGNRPSASSARKRVAGKTRRAPVHRARAGRGRRSAS
jgi:hypothetical protein